MVWLALGFWLIGSLSIGLPIARQALRDEKRLAVLVAYGLVAGHAVQNLVMVILWRLMPLGPALCFTIALSLLIGTAAILRGRRSMWDRERPVGIGLPALAAILLLALVFLYLAQMFFTAGYTALEVEALFTHSAIVGWIAQGTYPPTNPLRPDDPLQYRFGIHALAAAVSSAAGSTPPHALAATVGAVMPMAVLALVGLSIRAFGRPGPGIVASLLGMFGGSLMPWYVLVQSLGSNSYNWSDAIVQALDQKWRMGFIWQANTLDMLVGNVTIPAGFVAFTGALWLSWEAVRPSASSRPVAIGSAIAAMAYLGLTNEVYFVALAGGLLAGGAVASLRSRLDGKREWSGLLLCSLAIASAAYLLVAVNGGIAGGIGLSETTGSSLRMTLNTSHLGEVLAGPRMGWAHWVPLLSTDVFFESDFWLVGTSLLLLSAFMTRNLLGLVGLSASAAAFAAWNLFYPINAPADIYRFAQAAFVIYLTVIPFGLVRSKPWTLLSRRVQFWTASISVVFLTAAHLYVAVSIALWPPDPVWAVPETPDYLAAGFLRQSIDTKRVLVPLDRPDEDWSALTSIERDSAGSAMRILVGLSGHAIPVGAASWYYDNQRYLPNYRLASATLDSDALRALRIDWVYILPTRMSDEQMQRLRAAESRGELQLAAKFGIPGTSSERLLLRVREADPKSALPSH